MAPYNKAMWPAPGVLAALAIMVLVVSIRPMQWSGEAIAGILGFLRLWVALVYHLRFFAGINPHAGGHHLSQFYETRPHFQRTANANMRRQRNQFRQMHQWENLPARANACDKPSRRSRSPNP